MIFLWRLCGAGWFCFAYGCAGIRFLLLLLLLPLLLLSLSLSLFAGIRELLACFRRRPCAGRHLLFFAAAKKSRQKKAAHTANS